jgi:hypothetical protein
MVQDESRRYRDWASMLWLGGALLVAIAVALFLQAGPREALFYIVFIVGVVLVIRLNQRRGRSTKTGCRRQTHARSRSRMA